MVVNDGLESDPEEETDEDAESDLMLHKAVSRTTDVSVQVDRPRGRVVLVLVEILALLAEIGVNAALVGPSSSDGGQYSRASAIARLSSWVYILLLTSSRLLFTTTERPNLPKLWNHTATLYGLQWLFMVFVFRSVIIHPPPRPISALVSADFACSCVLFILAITTRRGNKTLLVEHEDGLTPAKDQFASILSEMSYSWLDPLIWQGYKRALNISDVWNLKPSYRASAVLVDFRRATTTSKLAWRLFRYFDRTLLIQGIWTMLAGVFTFIPTLLMKFILEHVENPQSVPRNAAWLYVILLFCCGAIQAVGDGQSLWLGRKLSVKFRAIIIGELYTKALRRKAGAVVKHGDNDEQEQPKKDRANKRNKSTDDSDKDGAVLEDVDMQANVGKIINLMAIDSFKVSEICAYLHFLWASVPVQVAVAIVMLYMVLGLSSLAGVITLVFILPVNITIANQFRKAQNNILAGTDARIHSSNEVLQNIRIIKYFAWEQRFEDIVNDKRRTELKYLRKRYILWSCAATLWYGTPLLITLCTFFIYTVVEGKKLLPSIAFPALSMFSLLRVPLDRLADMVAHVLEAKVSIDRVENFLAEEETEKYSQLRHCNDLDSPRIGFDNATLSWGSLKSGSNNSGPENSSDAFRLIGMNIPFHIGKLNVIAGPTGSGKTSVLMALLGEMQLVEGGVYLPGGVSDREDIPVDPATGLTESVAFCAQEAWLVNATIKENILFASEFDENRYEEVIKVSALERDLDILDAGDQTLVGEKGISLSGGQKQRISLARAIYSNARHILLDDCLSAVDSHTAKHIFRHALMGPLMINRTCILVTHNVSLVLPQCAYLVVMDNGKVSAQGSAADVAASGALGEEFLHSRPTSGSASQLGSRVPSNLEETRNEHPTRQSANTNGAANGGVVSKQRKKASAAASHLAEEKVSGSVPLSTIKMYLRAMGSWSFWVLAVVIFIGQQLASLAPNVWIREWANAYEIKRVHGHDDSVSRMTTPASFQMPVFATNFGRTLGLQTPQTHVANQDATNDGVRVSYYLIVYIILAALYIIVSFAREIVLFWGSLHASWKIHRWLLRSVTHAKFKFFDSTPLGRIMNRFSKDMEAIDQEVAPTAIGMIHCLAGVIMIIVLISVITPGFLIAGGFITAVYCGIGAVYLNTSRDLKRLESIQRSPLYQQFGETLNGIVTIRAYGDGARFIQDNHRLINTYNRPYIYLWASNRWLSFRVDITGAFVSFFAAMFVLLNSNRIDAGAAGLSLTYAVTFTENILWAVRLYSENQQNMNSVERIEEYTKVEQEAQAIVPDNRPPRNWPTNGALNFVDYSTRYRPDLDQVLKHVTFDIQPGERVGIVGRTGAGKSSLALALFRGLEAETGKIVIDDVDIGQIGLQDLRESITIVPQDPTLFTGTIRSNLDPFGIYTDEEIFTSLRRVHLIGPAGASPYAGSTTQDDDNGESSTAVDSDTSSRYRDNKNMFLNLQSPISESGSNLSQGQRQLLCLARALLKSPKVLMMDEATASIDYATDAKIQDTLRELKDNTIITIAHRLQTIVDYDKVLVLDHGNVKEYDDPWQLINKSDGMFRSMCENSGDMESLFEGAKKAWEQKRLVDDS